MTTPAALGLSQVQFNWAVKVVAVVKARGLPVRAAHIAIATCLTESSLHMYANGNNPASLALPHDAVGYDHGSVGLFQQQVGGAANSTANWGTTAQCMDVNYSTGVFLNALTRFDWESMTNWDAAQKVQGSFDPSGGNYKVNDAHAILIGNSLWGATVTPAPAPKPTPAPAPHPTSGKTPAGTRYTVVSGDTLTSIAHKYPDADITAASLASINHIADPNVIHVGQVLWIRLPTTPAPVAKSYSVKSGDNLSAIAATYHTSVAQIVAWNKAKYPALATNANLIQIGWVIRVG